MNQSIVMHVFHGAATDLPSVYQQSIHQLLQQNPVFQIHSCELDTHPLTREDISVDRLCLHAGDFKNQSRFRARGWWISHGNE